MRHFLLLLLLGLGLAGRAQAQVIAWQHAYGTARNEEESYSVGMPAGGYMLMSRQSYLSGGGGVLYFVRLNAQGDTLWTKQVGPPNCVNAAPTGLLVDAVGNLLVTGQEYLGNTAFALKLTPNCDTIWTRSVHGTIARIITTAFIKPTFAPDGNYVLTQSVAHEVGTNSSTADQTILKLSASTGQTIWSRDLSPFFASNYIANTGQLIGIGRSPAGYTLFVQGGLPGQQVGSYGTLLLNDAGNLGRLRRRAVPLASQALSTPVALLDRQGNTVVATRQNLTKLSPMGDTLFSVSPPPGPFPAGSTWDAAALIEDAQGNYVVLGNTTNTVAFGEDFHLTRFRPSGQLVKDTLLYQPLDQSARSLVLAPDGTLLLSGIINPGPYGQRDMVALKFRGFRPLASRAGTALAGGLGLYPNPAAGPGATLVLPTGARGGTLTVFDALGRVVARPVVPAAEAGGALPLAVAGLLPGCYLVRYQAPDGATATARLLRP